MDSIATCHKLSVTLGHLLYLTLRSSDPEYVHEITVVEKHTFLSILTLVLKSVLLTICCNTRYSHCRTVVVLKHFPLDELQNHSDLCSVKYFKYVVKCA